MIRKLMMSAAFVLMGTALSAAVSTDVVVQSLSDQGFTRVEVKRGLTQVKVKAIRGDEKLDLVLDGLTGRILKQTMARTMFLDNKTPGFFVSERQRDFLTPNAAAPADHSDRQATVAPPLLPAPATGHQGGVVGSAMAVRVTQDYVGPAIDDGSMVAEEVTAGPDVQIDDGAFVGIIAGDYFPMDPVDADGDGLADEIVWDGDGIITIDDGWVTDGGDQGIVVGEPDPNGDGTGADGLVDWPDGTWVDGSDGTWVDDGTGAAGEDIVFHIMPYPMPPVDLIDGGTDGEPVADQPTDDTGDGAAPDEGSTIDEGSAPDEGSGTDAGSGEPDTAPGDTGEANPGDVALQ